MAFPSATVAATDGTDYENDALGRPLEIEENVTPYATTSYEYLNGNKIRVTNPRNKKVTTTYYALGSPAQDLPTQIDQAEGISTQVSRNDFGEMTQAKQYGGSPYVTVTRDYKYDSSHRLCRQVDPESGSTVYSYNAAGQIDWYALAASGSTGACNTGSVLAGEKITHSYNNMNQLTAVNYPDSSPDLAYTYDDNGNLKTLNSSSANWTYSYNKLNALTQETLVTNGQTFTTDYDFDTQDRLTDMDYPSGLSLSITPNAYGEPESVGSYASGIEYHPNGSIKALTYGNSRVYTTTQNDRQLPLELKIADGSSNIAKLTHYYDANANITSITDSVTPAANRSMTYDNVDRLKTASGIWGSGSYSYDVIGNIKTKNEGSDSISITYDSDNLVDDVVINSTTRSYMHDAYGNVTNNGNQTFTYNLAGNMVTSSSPSITNYYDGHKRRVRVKEGSNNEYNMYSQGGTLLHKKDGGVETDYIYAGSLLIAKKEGSNVHYLHTDLLGSPIDGKVGSTSYTENYSPWGEKLDNPIQLSDDVGYTGHQSDVATGLTYMQARYYDPVVGRFMAVDPVEFITANPMSFNRYLYVNNNPSKFKDPDGEFLVSALLGAAIGVAAEVASQAVGHYKETGGFGDFELDKSRVVVAAGAGFAVGSGAAAVSGLIASAGSVSTGGAIAFSAAGNSLVGGAVGGAAQVTNNAIEGQPLSTGVVRSTAAGLVAGGAGGATAQVATSAITKSSLGGDPGTIVATAKAVVDLGSSAVSESTADVVDKALQED